MTVKASAFTDVGMLALHVGTLPLLVAFEAEFCLGFLEHGLVLTGMNGVAVHAFSFLDWLMESGRAVELFCMAVEAEFIGRSGDVDGTAGGNLMAAVALAVLHRIVDHFL